MFYRESKIPQAEDIVEQNLRTHSFRPTVICCSLRVVSGRLETVAIKTPSGPKWGLVQGGIEAADATILAASTRELQQEVFGSGEVSARALAHVRHIGNVAGTGVAYAFVEKERGTKDFENGSLYIPTLTVVAGDVEFDPDPSAVTDVDWMPTESLKLHLRDAHDTQASTSRCARSIAAIELAETAMRRILQINS